MISDLVKITIFLVVSVDVSRQWCVPGRFGSRCQYMCHCKDNKNCGHTGTCSDGCEDGYFGYKCQYVDMFYSLAPRTYKTSDECNFEHLKNITLDSNYFRYARIVFKGDIPQFYTLNFIMEGDTDTHCDNFYQSKIDARTIEIICDQFIDIFMRSLSLVTDGDGVCRVSISRGRNLALKQQAMDPSTVDGNRYSTSACFYSQNWLIKFDIPATIHNFIIYSKQEIYVHETLTFVSTYTYRTGDAFETFRVNFTAPYGKTYSSPTPVRFPWPVSEIEIRVVNTGKKIYFCEVEVFGEIHCGDHRYGLECETTCQCLHQVSDCQKQNACLFNCSGMGLNTCRFICTSPYFERGCAVKCYRHCDKEACHQTLNGTNPCESCHTQVQEKCGDEVYAHVPYVPQTIDPYLPTDNATGQDPGSAGEECGSGFYGSHCMFVCSSWCDMQNCERENGTCYRCTIGRTGDFCEQNCSSGTYGQNCSLTCSDNCIEQTCNSVTGKCFRCPPNRTGDFCEEEVQVKKTLESRNCRSECGNNLCDRVTGACLGCPPGRVGDYCENECSIDTYGVNCSYVCDNRCFFNVSNSDRVCNSVTGDCELPYDPLLSKLTEIVDQDKGLLIVLILSGLVILALIIIFLFVCKNFQNFIPKEYKVVKEDQITAIPINQFSTYMAEQNSEFFLQDFEKIPFYKVATTLVGTRKENLNKNVDTTPAASDYTRVIINTPKGSNQNEYINASYVQGLHSKVIIASEAPNSTTFVDFLRILWDEQVGKIVMLNRDQEPYWSEEGKIIDTFRIKVLSTRVYADYTTRHIEIQKVDSPSLTNLLTHFHFTSWPEDGSDPCVWSLVDFEHRVFLKPTDSRTLVHCRNGTTRTSIFIALHDLILQAKIWNVIDFVKTVTKLRQDRSHMIETFEQYLLLHRAMLAGLACLGTYTHLNTIFLKIYLLGNFIHGKTNFEREFNRIPTFATCGEKDRGNDGGAFAGLVSKSRCSIIPNKKYIPMLHDDSDPAGGYINAVTVTSLNVHPKQFLTQLPLPTTTNDFWRLVTQYNVSLIVAFNVLVKDSSLGSYLPETKGQPLPCGDLFVMVKSLTKRTIWEERVVTVRAKTFHEVTHLTYVAEEYDAKRLLPFVLMIRSLKTRDGAVVYTCRNGAELSGLAYVLTTLIERLDQENYMTVPFVIGKVKSIRPQVIPTLQQYITVYETMKLYTESIISTARYRKDYSTTV